MNNMEANSLLRGLIFAVQKVRSDLKEGIGGDAVGEAVLEDLQPFLFGSQSVLPRLLEWQDRCKQSGIIAGQDMFNLTKFVDMKVPMALALLPMYGYPDAEPDVSWFTQSWPYLTDGLS